MTWITREESHSCGDIMVKRFRSTRTETDHLFGDEWIRHP